MISGLGMAHAVDVESMMDPTSSTPTTATITLLSGIQGTGCIGHAVRHCVALPDQPKAGCGQGWELLLLIYINAHQYTFSTATQ